MDINTLSILLGLIVTCISIATPIMKLNKTIATLTSTTEFLDDSLKELIKNNTDAHAKLWRHNVAQDKFINNHERRITNIEKNLKIKEHTNEAISTEEQND